MIRSIVSFYTASYALRLLALYGAAHHRYGRYLAKFWATTDFSTVKLPTKLTAKDRYASIVLRSGMALEVLLGVACIVADVTDAMTGGWQFGLALIIAYPLVWAHLLPLARSGWWLTHPKALGRAVLCYVLESQVKRLRRAHSFSVVGVAGSVGKTSTKIAIAKVLEASRRVQWQEGNYNDRVTVPLIFFGHNEPAIFNIFAWIRIIIANERIISRPYPYQVVVAELGTDGPGFMAEFAYVKLDVAVVTAVTPEHMAFFGTLDAVAREELTILHYAKRTLVNVDDTPAAYLKGRDYLSYGLAKQSTYHVSKRTVKGFTGQEVHFKLGAKDGFTTHIPLAGDQGAKIALAAASTAHLLDIPVADIEKGVAAISAFAGRMQILPGIKNSTIIDDTYNASPVAVKAALDVLQSGNAPQRIAIMGAMNELGDYSPEAHREVAEYCDPTKLDWVLALGPDAVKYLAPVAEARGCNVKTFTSPYKLGEFVRDNLKEGAVILAKGSQNRVFAEEALKVLLANPGDQAKLVRQSAYWLNIKTKQFK